MSIILLSDLSFGYEGSYQPVFEKLSASLDTDWRLGLTGRNGRGKTTLRACCWARKASLMA